MSDVNKEFDIDTELIEYIFRKSTHEGSIYNIDAIMKTMEEPIKNVKTVEELQNLFMSYENLVNSTTRAAMMQLNTMTCYIQELRVYHMAIEELNKNSENKIKPYDVEQNVLNMLYGYFQLEHIVNLLLNAQDLTVLSTSREKLEKFIDKYKNIMLDINKIIIPNMDMFLHPKTLEEFAVKKSMYVATGIPVMMYQYDLLLTVMIKKYDNITLTLDQIAEILKEELNTKFLEGYTYDTVKEIISKI